MCMWEDYVTSTFFICVKLSIWIKLNLVFEYTKIEKGSSSGFSFTMSFTGHAGVVSSNRNETWD